jgi:very-short-patch-repair endonuclease
MKNLNILVVRFRNKEIIDNIETVLEKLEIIISNRNSKI